jgi:AcrR family transcriptional regulator
MISGVGILGRRSLHSADELRELIVSAAQTIVERDGLTGLSAREIARHIGYSAGTLYNLFENIDEILLTVQIRLIRSVLDEMQRLPVSPDPNTYIDELAQAYVDFAVRNRHLWNLLFTHSPQNGSAVPTAMHELINSVALIVEDALRPLMSEASEEEVSEAARSMWAGVHGITAIAVTQKSPRLTISTATVFTRRLTKTYLAGLSVR